MFYLRFLRNFFRHFLLFTLARRQVVCPITLFVEGCVQWQPLTSHMAMQCSCCCMQAFCIQKHRAERAYGICIFTKQGWFNFFLFFENFLAFVFRQFCKKKLKFAYLCAYKVNCNFLPFVVIKIFVQMIFFTNIEW